MGLTQNKNLKQVSLQSFGLGIKQKAGNLPACSICGPGPAAGSRDSRMAVGQGFQKPDLAEYVVTEAMLKAGMDIYFEHDWQNSEVAPFLRNVFFAVPTNALAYHSQGDRQQHADRDEAESHPSWPVRALPPGTVGRPHDQ